MKSLLTAICLILLQQSIAYGSEYDAVTLSCNPQSLPYLDTTIGYSIPVPDGFEADGNPPTRFESTQALSSAAPSKSAGFSAVITTAVFAKADLESIRTVEVDHPKASGLTVRHDTFNKFDYIEFTTYAYAITRGDNSLVVNSTRPIDLNSLFECFI